MSNEAAKGEEVQAEEEGDDCDSVLSICEWESDETGSDSSSPTGHSDSKRKKKKKKKKNSVASDHGGSSGSGGNSSSGVSKKEAEKRFRAAMDLLTANDEDGMWIQLSDCHISDTKAKKISEALASNKQITSLDLSENHIGDEGAKALFEVLDSGGAPNLIMLNVLGNDDICANALDRLYQLTIDRCDLKIESGPLRCEQGEGEAEGGTAQQQQQHVEGVEGGEAVADGVEANGPSPLVRKYFQVGDDGEEENFDDDENFDDEESVDPEALAPKMWEAVDEALAADPLDLPALGELLGDLANAVGEEMSACALPMLQSTCADDLKPFTREALARLPQLPTVLSLAPPRVHHTFERTVAQPAVGTHRMEVGRLVAHLLQAGCRVVSEHVAQPPLVARLALLALTHPTCNALQCAVMRVVRAGLSSDVPALLAGLFEEGWGLPTDEQQQQQEGPPRLPLHKCLARIGSKHIEGSRGLRPAHIGFVIDLSAALHDATQPQQQQGGGGEGGGDAQGREQQQGADRGTRPVDWLKQALEGDADWAAYTTPGGVLERLRAEQRGGLGPPRPDRNDPDDRDFLLGGFGRVLNGQSLLAMLQGLHGGGGGPSG